VLRAFRSVNTDGQVLLVSGFGTLETAIEAVRAGAFDYSSKPFDIGEIKKTVQRALDQAGARPADQAPAVDVRRTLYRMAERFAIKLDDEPANG
jgi:DNA-binding NtrC family response regulator